MEYEQWQKLEREYPWIWRIVDFDSTLLSIGITRATHESPVLLSISPGVRVWFVQGAPMGRWKRPRVFEVRELQGDSNGSIRDWVLASNHGFGLHCLYIVIGVVPPRPGLKNLTIYKRPHRVDDFRSLF